MEIRQLVARSWSLRRRLDLSIARDAFRTRYAGLALAVAAFVFLYFNSVHIVFSQDEAYILYGTKQLLRTGGLEAGSALNEAFNTNIIGSAFVSYQTAEKIYFHVSPGTAFLFAPFIALGETGFFLTAPLFGAIATAAVFFLALRITRSYFGAYAAALVWIVAPVFAHWGTNYYNNVPVLAIELWALYFLVDGRLTTRQATIGGALMGIAVFVRPSDALLLPFLVCFVAMRTRSIRTIAAYVAPAAGFVGLFGVTNLWFFHSLTFVPHMASNYIPLAGETASTTVGWLERYLLYLTGTKGSIGNFSLLEKLENWGFHIRYLVSSYYAFPLLIPGIAGLAWGVLSRDHRATRLAVLLAIFFLFVVGFYGSQQDNYYGYGQSIVRSSFIRYSLPVYALSSVGVACLWAKVQRAATRLGRERLAYAGMIGLVAAGLTAGLAFSYDPDVYGFDRLNKYRRTGAAERTTIERLISNSAGTRGEVIVLAGHFTSKLVDVSTYPDTIAYNCIPVKDWPTTIMPALDAALSRGVPVVVVTAPQDEQGRSLIANLQATFEVKEQHRGSTEVYLVTERRGPSSHDESSPSAWTSRTD